MFDPGSRYEGIEIAQLTERDGRVVAYVRRRFLPQGRALPLLIEATVTQEERLDLLAARTLGDPEHFWRICDANDALNPFDLVDDETIGHALRVPVPQP